MASKRWASLRHMSLCLQDASAHDKEPAGDCDEQQGNPRPGSQVDQMWASAVQSAQLAEARANQFDQTWPHIVEELVLEGLQGDY